MKLLITGAKAATAFKIAKVLKNEQLILADYGDVPTVSNAYCELKSLGIKNEDAIAHQLLNFCLDHEVEAILPLYLEEIKALATSSLLFNEFNIEVWLPNDKICSQFLSTSGSSSKDWVIYNAGNLLFASDALKKNMPLFKDEQLSGAFYVNADFSLQLITVS